MFSHSRRQRVRLGPRWPDLKQDQHLDHNRSQYKLSVCSSALESVRPYFFIWENWLLATTFLSSYQTEVSTSRSTLTVPWNNRSLFYYQKGAAHNSDFLFHHKVVTGSTCILSTRQEEIKWILYSPGGKFTVWQFLILIDWIDNREFAAVQRRCVVFSLLFILSFILNITGEYYHCWKTVKGTPSIEIFIFQKWTNNCSMNLGIWKLTFFY